MTGNEKHKKVLCEKEVFVYVFDKVMSQNETNLDSQVEFTQNH